jgi:protein ImuB
VADGPFAAELAARDRRARPVRVVPPGGSPDELAPRPVTDLGRPELADLLVRLGLVTLGDLAALDPADLLARFGDDGLVAHRLASGLDERSPATTAVAPDLRVHAVLDPPADRVDTAAFTAKVLADDLHARLTRESLWCTRVVVTAETDHDEVSERVWRHEGALDAGALADRVRWQLDGWLNGSAVHRPTGGIAVLRLAPDEVVPARGRQHAFWGGEAGADDRVVRAVARLEGLLGAGAVTVPEWRGGRDPASRMARIPAGAVVLRADRASARPASHAPPWPGRIPDPAPALVHDPPLPVVVLDREGHPLRVSGRGSLSAVPASVARAEGEVEVVAWAGPWPVEERWWDPVSHRRRARLQVVLADGRAHLLGIEHGTWAIEATYD